jgi:hypothetical protein
MKKEATSFRLSPEALRLTKEMADRFGLSQAAVIEMAVRMLAEQHIVKNN